MENQIDEIKKLYSDKDVFLIPEHPKDGESQASITIYALNLEETSVLDFKEDASAQETTNNAIKLFSKSLRINESDVKKISLRHMEELMKAIMSVNNFSDKDMKKSGIKKFLEEKRKLNKSEE